MNKSRLYVFQLKDLIYTALLTILAIILIIVLINMFSGNNDNKKNPNNSESVTTSITTAAHSDATYVPGIYCTKICLNNQTIELKVALDKDRIKSISTTNLSNTVEAMFPLLEPSIEYIETELAKGTPIDEIQYDESSIYTGTMLTEAISEILEEASL